MLDNQKKTVLLLCDGRIVSGGQIATLNLLKQFSNSSLRMVPVVLYAKNREHDKLSERIRELGYMPIVVPIVGYVDFLLPLRIAKELEHNRADIVQTESLRTDFYGFLVSLYFRIPMISVVHDNFYYFLRDTSSLKLRIAYRVRFWLLRRISKIICVSNFAKQVLTSRGGIPDQRIRVINNSVDLHFWNEAADELKESNSLGRFKPYILCVTRLDEDKGIDVLVEAFLKVTKQAENLKCVVIGNGKLAKSIDIMVEELGLHSKFFLIGYKQQNEVRNWLRSALFFVLPSLIENFSLSLLEAAACGKALVATNVGGTPEIIQHNVNGLLVEPGNCESLAEAILELYGRDELRAGMEEQNRLRSTHYAGSNIAQQYVRIYDGL